MYQPPGESSGPVAISRPNLPTHLPEESHTPFHGNPPQTLSIAWGEPQKKTAQSSLSSGLPPLQLQEVQKVPPSPGTEQPGQGRRGGEGGAAEGKDQERGRFIAFSPQGQPHYSWSLPAQHCSLFIPCSLMDRISPISCSGCSMQTVAFSSSATCRQSPPQCCSRDARQQDGSVLALSRRC